MVSVGMAAVMGYFGIMDCHSALKNYAGNSYEL